MQNLRPRPCASGHNTWQSSGVLRQMGDYDQAKALYERALAVKQNHYGQDHVQVAITLGNLAGVLSDMGDYEQAKAL